MRTTSSSKKQAKVRCPITGSHRTTNICLDVDPSGRTISSTISKRAGSASKQQSRNTWRWDLDHRQTTCDTKCCTPSPSPVAGSCWVHAPTHHRFESWLAFYPNLVGYNSGVVPFLYHVRSPELRCSLGVKMTEIRNLVDGGGGRGLFATKAYSPGSVLTSSEEAFAHAITERLLMQHCQACLSHSAKKAQCSKCKRVVYCSVVLTIQKRTISNGR